MILQALPDVNCYHEHTLRMKKSCHMRMRKELDNTTIKVYGGGHCFYMGGDQQPHCSAAPPPAPLPPHGFVASQWLRCFLTYSAASLAPVPLSVCSAAIRWVHCSSRLLRASPPTLFTSVCSVAPLRVQAACSVALLRGTGRISLASVTF